MAECTVLIWKLAGNKPYTVAGLAHGALQLVTRQGFVYYITLWNNWASGLGGIPGCSQSQNTDASRPIGFKQIRNRKTGKIQDNPYARGEEKLPNPLTADIVQDNANSGGKNPDATCNIPIAYDGDNLFGVSDRRIAQFWKRVLDAPPGHPIRRYALFSTSNNCCGIVADALCEGGLDFYAPPPGNLIYQDARTLFKWVEKAVARIVRMNAEYVKVRPLLRDVTEDTIPSYKDWKKESDQGVGFFASRTMQISFIDDYIKAYHQAFQKKDKVGVARALIRIQFEAFDHLTKKPNSDRRAAVLRLAGRVRNVMKRLQREYEEAAVETEFEQQPDVNQWESEEDRQKISQEY